MTTETTTYTQIVVPTEFVTLDELEARMLEARENMEAAWKVQAQTTVDEGYTMDQANEAIYQAKLANAAYREAYRAYEDALKKLAVLQEDYEVETVDGLVAL